MTAESIVVTALAALIAVAFGRERVVLLIVVVPVFLPMLTVVAAPPRLTVVAVVLNRLPVVEVVESVPPLTAALPEVVILPVATIVPLVEILPDDPTTEKLVPVRLDAPSKMPVT